MEQLLTESLAEVLPSEFKVKIGKDPVTRLLFSYMSSISTKTDSGVLILIKRLRKRSFGSTSTSRLWILIWNLSHVFVPSPHGLFRVVRFSLLVGSGIGPLILTPVFSAILPISSHTPMRSFRSTLDSLILALLTMRIHASTYHDEAQTRTWRDI